MIHIVCSVKYAKEFLLEHHYGCKLWSKYPNLLEILLEKYPEYKGARIFILNRLLMKHRKEISYIAEERWTLILIDAYNAAEEIERILQSEYGMKKEVVMLEVYPHIEKAWRIKKKPRGRKGKPMYFVRRTEKIIGETKGGVFLAVPKEYKSVLEEYFPLLEERYARYVYE